MQFKFLFINYNDIKISLSWILICYFCVTPLVKSLYSFGSVVLNALIIVGLGCLSPSFLDISFNKIVFLTYSAWKSTEC